MFIEENYDEKESSAGCRMMLSNDSYDGVGGSGSRIHGRIHDLPRVLFPGFNLSTTQILTQFASNSGHGQLVLQVNWYP